MGIGGQTRRLGGGIGWVLLLATTLWAAEAAPPPAAKPDRKAPAPKPRLGTNLNGPADWNTELPFVDVFRLARTWISQRKDQPWGKGPALALDKHGWVTRLEADCWAETPLCTIDGGHFPGGQYTVLYEGEGKIDFSRGVKIASSTPGKMLIDVDPSGGGFFLSIRQTKADNYVRNIRVVMPGFADKYQAEPFHPVFLKRWQGMACLRFMDWMHTNGSKIRAWADRPTPETATFSPKGVALEWMIDLSNRLQADPWFCMPHQADDEFIRNFAKLVHAKLDPKLKVYVEYSNEVWNSQFPQTRYSWEQGKQLGLGPKERPWEGGGMYYARRSAEIFRIWAEAFGGTGRLVRVIAWQSGNTHWMRNIVLPHQDAWKLTDALAIAPYIQCSIPAKGREPSAQTVQDWSVDQVLDYMASQTLPRSVKAMAETKKVADEFGLTMVAYEAGQHMVGTGGGENNAKMTALFHAANAHPRMGELYARYLAAWTDAGGDLLCNFSSVGRWSKWGSWGVLQFYDDDPAKSPKFAALMRWAKSLGQPVSWPQ